jgi:ketosteroid isomerase-like protein
VYSWIVGRVVRLLVGRLNAGDVRTLMWGFAPDAHLVFPGSSSFGGDHAGKDAIRAWLERFVALGPNLSVKDVAVAGGPQNMRVCFRFTDRIPIPDGGEYANEGMEYLRIRWGRIHVQHIYLDTERVTEFDRRLEAAASVASR